MSYGCKHVAVPRFDVSHPTLDGLEVELEELRLEPVDVLEVLGLAVSKVDEINVEGDLLIVVLVFGDGHHLGAVPLAVAGELGGYQIPCTGLRKRKLSLKFQTLD